MPYNGYMGRIKDLDAIGVRDLFSYNAGVSDERDRLRKALEAEQKRTGLGFIQYKVLAEILESSAVNKSTNA